MLIDELKAKLQGTKEDRDVGMVVLNELIAVAVATKEYVEVETDIDRRHINFQRMVEHPMFSVPGLNYQTLASLSSGSISINKKGVIKVPLAIDSSTLGHPYLKDLRVVMPPHCNSNKLVPTLCFIDPIKVLDHFNNKL